MAQINIIDYNKIVYFDENTGNYKIFDGERWWLSDDKFGTSTKPSGVALVDSAIVDKSVVGEEEAPPMQTIWEGTFTGTERTQGGVTFFVYEATDMQNAELLMDINEVTVTFDGVQYILQVETYVTAGGGGASFGATTPQQFEDFPFLFDYEYENEEKFLGITTHTAGPHTLKVEYTPVEPSSEVLYENTFSGTSLNTADVQNLWKITEMQAVKATFDGTSYILNVDRDEEWDMWSLGDSAFADCPFFLMIVEITDTDTETSETSYEMTIETGTSGEHTIKIETTDAPTGDPIEDIGVLPLQPGKI